MTRGQFVMILGGSLTLMAVIAVGVASVDFGLSLTPSEKGILMLRYEKVQIKERRSSAVSVLRNPMESGAVEKRGYPPVSLAEIAPPSRQRVSLVLIRGEKRMAIIDNLVVREGDSINEARIARIEKRGVLVRSKEGERWLEME